MILLLGLGEMALVNWQWQNGHVQIGRLLYLEPEIAVEMQCISMVHVCRWRSLNRSLERVSRVQDAPAGEGGLQVDSVTEVQPEMLGEDQDRGWGLTQMDTADPVSVPDPAPVLSLTPLDLPSEPLPASPSSAPSPPPDASAEPAAGAAPAASRPAVSGGSPGPVPAPASPGADGNGTDRYAGAGLAESDPTRGVNPDPSESSGAGAEVLLMSPTSCAEKNRDPDRLFEGLTDVPDVQDAETGVAAEFDPFSVALEEGGSGAALLCAPLPRGADEAVPGAAPVPLSDTFEDAGGADEAPSVSALPEAGPAETNPEPRDSAAPGGGLGGDPSGTLVDSADLLMEERPCPSVDLPGEGSRGEGLSEPLGSDKDRTGSSQEGGDRPSSLPAEGGCPPAEPGSEEVLEEVPAGASPPSSPAGPPGRLGSGSGFGLGSQEGSRGVVDLTGDETDDEGLEEIFLLESPMRVEGSGGREGFSDPILGDPAPVPTASGVTSAGKGWPGDARTGEGLAEGELGEVSGEVSEEVEVVDERKGWFEVSANTNRMHFHGAEDGSRPLGLNLPMELLLMEGVSATVEALLLAVEKRWVGKACCQI